MKEIDEKRLRDKLLRGRLQKKRNLLFEEFRKSPSNTRLATDIKLIDDVIASLTERLTVRERKL